MNFSEGFKHVLPLCSPRKTSLNFLRGFPKSLPTDMLRRRRKWGNSGQPECSRVVPVACGVGWVEVLGGEGGGVGLSSAPLARSLLSTRDENTHCCCCCCCCTGEVFFSFFLPPHPKASAHAQPLLLRGKTAARYEITSCESEEGGGGGHENCAAGAPVSSAW